MLFVMLLIVTFIAFTIIYFLPGSPLPFLSMRAEASGLTRALGSLGLSGTFFGNFILFVVDILMKLDSSAFAMTKPVALSTFSVRVKYTLMLCLCAVVISWIVGLPLGIAAATHRGKALDNILTGLSVAFGSMPSFWVGLMLLLVFSGILNVIPVLFFGTKSMILPIVTLSICNLPTVSGAVRAGIVDAMGKDFIVAARSKGLRERLVINRHAVRNAFLPLLSVLSSQLTKAFGGALVIERVFSVPGLGSLMFDSISSRDIFTVMVCLLISACISGVVSLLADVIYTVVNPSLRQRYE